jgi:hypothetical protein
MIKELFVAPILPPLTMALFCSFFVIMPLRACNPRHIVLKAGAHALLVETTIHHNKNDVDLLVMPGNSYEASGDVQRTAVLMALSGLHHYDKVFDVRPVERLCFNNTLLLRSPTRPWEEVLMRLPSRMSLLMTPVSEYTWPEFYPNEKVTLISHLDFGKYHGLAPLYNEAVGHIFAEKPSFDINAVARAMEKGVEARDLPQPIKIPMQLPLDITPKSRNTIMDGHLFKQRIKEHGINDALWTRVKPYFDVDNRLGRSSGVSNRAFISAVVYRLKTKIEWKAFNECWGIAGLTLCQRWSRLRRHSSVDFKGLKKLLIQASKEDFLESDSSSTMDCSEELFEDYSEESD